MLITCRMIDGGQTPSADSQLSADFAQTAQRFEFVHSRPMATTGDPPSLTIAAIPV
jgi:hypothetical protein